MNTTDQSQGDAYKKAGVDIDKADTLLANERSTISSATRPEVLSQTGAFGGLFQPDLSGYTNPVLVNSIDGVGTKLMVAAMADAHHHVGYDIVHHCINDVVVQGAEPLYFLDYLGTGELDDAVYKQLLRGIADACAGQNVALLGGETAEMPGMYGKHYDLVGCITGIVEREHMITGDQVEEGDKLVVLPSNGLHTNGYSLARQVLFQDCGYSPDTELPETGMSVAETLLQPHVCYWPAVRELLHRNIPLHAAVHVTGGGIYGNIPRVLPSGLGVTYDPSDVAVPKVFQAIGDRGNVAPQELYKVFNMGAGMIWILPPSRVEAAIQAYNAAQGEGTAVVAGEVTRDHSEQVKIKGIDE